MRPLRDCNYMKYLDAVSCYLSFKTYNVELCKDSNCDTPWIRESGTPVKCQNLYSIEGKVG